MTTRPATTNDLNHLRKQTSVYVAILKEQIEIRAREYGYAWVTPQEHAWLDAHGLLTSDVMVAPAGTLTRRDADSSRRFSVN
jgi:hypothetical protein